jgi:uncharacterized protein (DUF2345 family)
MASRIIRADNKLKLQAPIYEVTSDNYYLTNVLPTNDSNTQILSRNTLTGELQVCNKGSANFSTTLNNIGSFTSLVADPGLSISHSIKTLRSSDGSILLTPGVSDINLQAVITLSNASVTGYSILQNIISGNNFLVKTIVAGSNINITSDVNTLTISTPGTITQINRGLGVQILHDPGTSNNFTYKSLKVGGNMSINSNDDEITIGTTLTGNITQNNLGAGEAILYDPGTENHFNFRTLIAGSGISLTSDTHTVTITSNITQSNRGLGIPILTDPGTDTTFAFRTILAGSNITLTSDSNTMTINNTLTGNITQTNLGIGSQILSDPGTDNSFAFKSLVAGSNILLSSDTNSITISSSNITQNNLGLGLGILSNPGIDTVFSYKSLIAGPNIQLIPTANDITIGTTLTGNITQTNIGLGVGVLSNVGTLNSFAFKSINSGSNITVTSDSNNIYISTPLTGNITQTKLGSGEGLLSTFGTLNSFGVKSLVAGSGILLTSDANEITISNTGSLVNVDLQNIGTGISVLNDPGIGNMFHFKKILAGTGIQINSPGDDIIISNDGSSVNVTLNNQTLLGEAILFNPGLGNSFNFKTLLAGVGISLTSDNNSITLNSTGISAITQNNIGVGTVLLSDPGTDSSFSFKSINTGSHLSLNDDGSTITINTDLTGNITQNNLGLGEPIIQTPGTSNTFGIKSLIAGSNILLTSDLNTITIASDDNITQNNLGAGQHILSNPGTSNTFSYKSINAGSNMVVTSDANNITISNGLTGNITQSNLGAGTPILSNPGVDNSFAFKSLVAGTNVTIASDVNTITINGSDYITQNNLGTGEVILSNTGLDSTFNFKTIKQGNNMVLSSTANELTISTTLTGDITLSNLGAGEQIIADPGTNDHYNVKSLVAGTNISLTSDSNSIIIDNTASGHITQSNLGLGESVLSNPSTGDTFTFKSIVGSANISVGSDADTVIIGTTLTGDVTMHAVGTGDNILSDPGTDNDFSFKSLLAGSNINILPVGNDIVISAPQQNVSLNNLGVGANVLATPGTLSSFDFKTLIQGAGISLSNGSNSITISSNITQSNIGIGPNKILKNPGTSITFDFKSIIAGAGINITNGVNDLTFASNISSNNVGVGSGIVATTSTGSSLDFKSLIAGTGITLSSNSTSITINATPFAGVTINNVGVGSGRIMKTAGTALSFDVKSLLAGTNISLVNGVDDITLNIPNSNMDNLGAGLQLLTVTGSASLSTIRTFKSLLAGTNITLSSTANDITISASTQNSNMANLGAGEQLLAVTGSQPLTTTRNFKTLLAGSNITLNSTANDITINATGSVTPTSYGFSVELSVGALPSVSVNPTYNTVAPYITPAYGFNSGLLNIGTGVFTIGASDVGTYVISFYIQVSSSNAAASNKNYVDIIFINTTTNTRYVNYTQDMPSNGIYVVGFTKPFNLTAGNYEMRVSKQRTRGTFTVYNGIDTTYSAYRIA